MSKIGVSNKLIVGLAFCFLALQTACRNSDENKQDGTLPEVQLGQETFRILGVWTKAQGYLEGTGSVQSLEQLQKGRNSFELEFSLPDTKSSLALNLFSRPGQAEGLNIRFYEKAGQLETFTDYSDAQDQVVSVIQKLGPYTAGTDIKLHMTLELLETLPPAIQVRIVDSGSTEEQNIEFDPNSKPFPAIYESWGAYLGDARLLRLDY